MFVGTVVKAIPAVAVALAALSFRLAGRAGTPDPEPAGERPMYFELAPKPRPVPYGEEAAEFPAYEPMIVKGRRYARALIAGGRFKPPAKAEGKE
jgi:hypothetical protein